jgi:hypothetical protein
MRPLMGTPVEARSGWRRWWSFCIVRQRISLYRRRALTLDASFILHWWLADDRKEKSTKASKRDGYRHKLEGKFITLKAQHPHSNWRIFGFEAPI